MAKMRITGRAGLQVSSGMPATAARAAGSATGSPGADTARPSVLTHPRYDQWIEDWIGLGHVYEGDGPYLDGSALIPHSRELLYHTDENGTADFSRVTGQSRKFQQRRALAYYENFASVVVDTLVEHQFGKRPARAVHPRGVLGHHPIERFWEDVDGFGTPMDDWLQQAMTLAHVYGHGFVVMDRLEHVEASLSGRLPRVRTRAQASRPVLRLYVPPDVPDWLAPGGFLSSVKLRESRERASLLDTRATTPEDEYLVYDDRHWIRMDPSGRELRRGEHHFGRLPVRVLRAHPRARIPVLGRSTLRDYRLYRDHYNMLSELREIFRGQTFSMLNIRLHENETVEQARAKLGQHAGTDSLIFSTNGAEFIAPPDGPIKAYAEQIHRQETKIFRLIGLPYEQDNRQGVSEGTARLKAMDVNRLLSACATRCERLEYDIALLWASAEYGADKALSTLDADDLIIQHPDEFYTEQLAEIVADATATIALGLGPTATGLIKTRVLHVALRDASREQIAQMTTEIEDRAAYDAEEAELVADAARRSGRPGSTSAASPGTAGAASGDGAGAASTDGKGTDPNNRADGAAGRSTDPRATAPRPASGTRETDPGPRRAARTIQDLRARHRRTTRAV